jgi:hypothetical protein
MSESERTVNCQDKQRLISLIARMIFRCSLSTTNYIQRFVIMNDGSKEPVFILVLPDTLLKPPSFDDQAEELAQTWTQMRKYKTVLYCEICFIEDKNSVCAMS